MRRCCCFLLQFDTLYRHLLRATLPTEGASNERQRRDGREASFGRVLECVEHDGASARELLPAAAVADVAAGTH
jgi:hypothetical protein